MGQNLDLRRLRRRFIIERVFFLSVIILLLGRYVVFEQLTAPYRIEVNGRPVAFLSSRRAAERVIADVKGSPEARFEENVTIVRGSARDRPMSESEARRILADAATVVADAWMIFINGEPAIALPSEEMAASVLNRARDRFGLLASNLMEVPTFKEDVKVQPAHVKAGQEVYTDVEAAVTELVGHPRAAADAGRTRVHIVRGGELASRIARDYHITLDQLAKLNPGVDLDRLQIGDRLVVSRGANSGLNGQGNRNSRAKLTVIVRDAVTTTERIPYRTETITSVRMRPGKRILLSPGRPGLRRVKRAITYENGIRTDSEIIEETVLRQPIPERIAVGIGR